MRRKISIIIVLVVGGVIGYVIGPPVVQAATNLVTVKDPKTQAKARVTNGNLWTDSSGSVVYALTEPISDLLLISGTSDSSKDGQGFLSGIVVNVSAAGSSPVTVNIRKGTTTSGTIAWQGTIESTGHIADDFSGNINIASGFYVQVLNPGGASVRYDVYGCCFGLKAAPRINAPMVTASKPSP